MKAGEKRSFLCEGCKHNFDIVYEPEENRKEEIDVRSCPFCGSDQIALEGNLFGKYGPLLQRGGKDVTT